MYSEHNPITHSEYPNALAPEDIEMMLQNEATPVIDDVDGGSGLSSPNPYAGYGRVNAEATMNNISLPYRIRHFQGNVNTSSAVLHASNQTVTFPEGIPGLASGYYVGSTDVYKLAVTLNHNIPSSETYLNGWVRNSSCELYSNTNTIANPHWSGVVMNSSNQNGATLTGYIYKAKIYNVLGQYVGDRWFPTDLNSNVQFAYSIRTVDDDPNVGVEENKEGLKVNVFPNPTMDQLKLKLDLNSDFVSVDIYDIAGRHISRNNFSNLGNSEQYKSIDVSDLKSGLYLCRITVGDEKLTRKFIKK